MGQKLTDRTELSVAPASDDFLHVVDVSDITDDALGTSKKIKYSNFVSEITADVSEITTDVSEITTDFAVEHNADGTHKTTGTGLDAFKLVVMSAINPIGTIREFNVSTNPATLLGFGTWSAFGTGRVTVAIDSGQTEFDTNGETGGAKTHLLTGAESGTSVHNHTGTVTPSTVLTTVEPTDWGSRYGAPEIPIDQDRATSVTINNSSASDASSAHNNLQPYIIVYRWVRVA